MGLTSYNGFTPAERNNTWIIQQKLRDDGIIFWTDKACEMCGQFGDAIMPHLENYDLPERFNPLCIECHMSLHGRFRSKGGWIDYLLKLRGGYKPNMWSDVSTYFKSQENRDFFNKAKVDYQFELILEVWYENLSLVDIDLKNTLFLNPK